MIANIGANTFIVFMAFDIVATIFCWFFIKETRGKNLEIAAGTEWEVVEVGKVSEGDGEKGELEVGSDERTGGTGGVPGMKGLDVVDVRDTFAEGLKHRN